MKFRENQINRFVEETGVISEMISSNVDKDGNIITEDEYISQVIENVREGIVSLTEARITILNYLNHQVDTGNGQIFMDMREEFIKVNAWVRNIEIAATGKPLVDETESHVETGKPMVTKEELQVAVEFSMPPGFREFTGAEKEAIEEFQRKVEDASIKEAESEDEEDYDPYSKPLDMSEADWEKRFNKKEVEAQAYILASNLANNNPLFDIDILQVSTFIISKKNTDFINKYVVQRVNELINDDDLQDLDSTSSRLGCLVVANNLFSAIEHQPIDVSFSERKALTVRAEVVLPGNYIRPSNWSEAIQFIMIRLAALRPIDETYVEVMKRFIDANKTTPDIEHLLEILGFIGKAYSDYGFVDSAANVSKMLEAE